MTSNELFQALADTTRRQILMELKKGKISSGDLAITLNKTPQALSYYLNKLKKAGLIYETKYKNYIYYELDLTLFNELLLWISELKGDN